VVIVSGRALGGDVPPGVRFLYKPYRIDAVEEILAQLRLQRHETGDPGDD
jgi:hypothetical protein